MNAKKEEKLRQEVIRILDLKNLDSILLKTFHYIWKEFFPITNSTLESVLEDTSLFYKDPLDFVGKIMSASRGDYVTREYISKEISDLLEHNLDMNCFFHFNSHYKKSINRLSKIYRVELGYPKSRKIPRFKLLKHVEKKLFNGSFYYYVQDNPEQYLEKVRINSTYMFEDTLVHDSSFLVVPIGIHERHKVLMLATYRSVKKNAASLKVFLCSPRYFLENSKLVSESITSLL